MVCIPSDSEEKAKNYQFLNGKAFKTKWKQTGTRAGKCTDSTTVNRSHAGPVGVKLALRASHKRGLGKPRIALRHSPGRGGLARGGGDVPRRDGIACRDEHAGSPAAVLVLVLVKLADRRVAPRRLRVAEGCAGSAKATTAHGRYTVGLGLGRTFAVVVQKGREVGVREWLSAVLYGMRLV